VPTENNAFTGTVQLVVIETDAKEHVEHLISREELLRILTARQQQMVVIDPMVAVTVTQRATEHRRTGFP
jgi:hypothetical protein